MSSRKRRKLDTETPSGQCFGEAIAELDLEISLKRRLAETIESRITWALVLEEALKKGSSGSTTSFKDAAFEAITAIETPLDILFTREITPMIESNHVKRTRLPRPPRREKGPRNPNANFLYIKSADLHPPYDENHIQTYLLRCSKCLRTTFTSLQGLLNHARISHGLEWGTHDECVRACAVVDPDVDVEAGIEVGLGLSGILPGLRSLFQMAVAAPYPKEPKTQVDAESDKAGNVRPSPTSSHLVRTLGLHEDTPALAPFLGKQVVRRSIKVWDDGDEVVDIDGFNDDKVQSDEGLQTLSTNPRNPHRTWKMHFTHRNDFEPEPVSKLQEMGLATNAKPDQTHRPSTTPTPTPPSIEDRSTTDLSTLGVTGSRFHFAARVIIVDRSFWIPPDKRPISNKGHTHKWMISVDSPSYSHHITTILKRVMVSSLADRNVLTTTCPPFVVVGTTDEPFLAKVELHFSGAPGTDGEISDQSMVLEHWVELDLLKSATPVVGDEQVADIELDKGTILLPIQKGYTPIGAKVLWSKTAETRAVKGGTNKAEPTQVYGEILSSIVGRFPMTLKEAKSGRQTQLQVPYKLVPTAQFKGLVPGRRKAIEWNRARAIRDAYNRLTRESRFAGQDPIPLSTADVYSWLSEEGHFIRPADAIPKKEHSDISAKDNYVETWCPTCGQESEAHAAASTIKNELMHPPSTSVKTETVLTPDDDSPGLETTRPSAIPCNIARRVSTIPMVNTCIRIRPSSSTGIRQTIGTLQDMRIRKFRSADLLATSNPNLTLAVHSIIHSLKLPAFPSPFQNGQALFPLDELGTDKIQVENHIAPHAALAIVAQRFMRILVEGGLDVARKEKAASISSDRPVIKKRKWDAKENTIAISVLTPTHILSSVISRAHSNTQSSVLGVAIFECLARLGVPATPKEPSTVGGGSQGHTQESTVSVKQEEEF